MRSIIFGTQIGVLSDDPAFLFEDIRALRPFALSGVPRFWEVVRKQHGELLAHYSAVMSDITPDRLEKLADEEIRQSLGGRLLSIVVGGAPVSPGLMAFLRRCFPGSASESYGTTESSGIYRDNMVVPGVEVKLVDWEEYTSRDVPFPRGEARSSRLSSSSPIRY